MGTYPGEHRRVVKQREKVIYVHPEDLFYT